MIDRFADNKNFKTKVFNSKYWCSNTACVDAFSTSWQHENNYLVPPIHLIPKAIKQLRLSKAQVVLVDPFWPSAAFWPLLFNHQNPQSLSKRFQNLSQRNSLVSIGK